MKYGFLKDKNGNKICINDNSIYHEGENLNEVINAKQDKLIAGTGIEITDENTINNIQGNYSTKEVKIGKWIDGKPLYRRIYNFALPSCGTSGTAVIESHTINNAKFSFIEFGYIYSDFITAPMPYFTRQNPSYNMGYDLTTPTNLRIWNSFKDWNSARILVSILYTKTTD